MVTKGDGPNQGQEFLYQLERRPDFQKDLIRIRKKLGIFEKGFLNPETRQKLWIENKHADMQALLGIELYLKQKYEVPVPYWQLIDDYIFFGKPVNTANIKWPVAIIDHGSPTGFESIEKFYDSVGIHYTKLFIFDNATKTKVFDFINKHWREIELTLNINISKNKRVRATINKERNREIRRLRKLPIKQLILEAGSEITKVAREKDSIVAKILVKKKLAKKELSEGSIRRLANEK